MATPRRTEGIPVLGELIRPVTWVYDLLRTYTKYKVNSGCSHWILVSGWQSNSKTGGHSLCEPRPCRWFPRCQAAGRNLSREGWGSRESCAALATVTGGRLQGEQGQLRRESEGAEALAPGQENGLRNLPEACSATCVTCVTLSK